MAHKADFTERLEVEDNKIVRVVRAYWKDKEQDVYKEFLDGSKLVRYLNFSYCGGYTVEFPGEKRRGMSRYWYGEVVKEEPFVESNPLNIWCHCQESFNPEELIEAEPRLKYFFKKIPHAGYGDNQIMPYIHYQELMVLMQTYLEHPECEELVRMGLYMVAMNKSLYRLSKPKLKAVINFIKNNPDQVNGNTKLQDIQRAIKYNTTVQLIEKFHHYSWLDYDCIEYLTKNKIDVGVYRDYINMAKKCGHDVEQEYWKYPKDFNNAHEKVMLECKNIEETKNRNVTLKMKYALANMKKKIGEVMIDGYQVYIPDELSDISFQADKLHQCLIRCDYPSKVINQTCILVFIRKDNEPVATAEIFYDKKIGQFYGDERDRSNCKPPEEVKSVLNKWLEGFKPIKRNMSKYIEVAANA